MSHKKHKKTQKVSLGRFLNAVAIGLAVATLLGFLGRLHWVLDLFSHFRVQYFQFGLILIAFALWDRRNKRAIALVLLTCLNYAFVLPFYFDNPAPASTQQMRAMLMNINASNGNTDLVLNAIHEADPDILLLEEVTPKWAHELAVLNTDYPHRIAEPQDGCFGVMLLSKYPLSHERVVRIGSADLPSIITDIHFPQGSVSIIGTHPLPPMNGNYSRQRNSQLAGLAKAVREQKYPVLLIGDLNTSPWSPYFTQLLRDSGLKNSMKGFGFQPSWPRSHRLLRIPLDHVLHSAEISIHNRMVGGDIGSDHFPVIVDFSVKGL